MASVLNGNAPLTRSGMSGGVQLTRKEQFDNRKFGTRSRLMTFGRMHIPIEMAYNKYFVIGMAIPLKSINKNFTAFFKFYKEARKSDLKHQGRGGFYGMFKEFIDFKVWKKIFGIAKDPQIAALHQIRDILIATSGRKKKELIAAGLQIDPVEMWTAAPKVLKGFFDKYKSKGHGFFGNLIRMVKGTYGEISETGNKQEKIRQELVLGAKRTRLSTKTVSEQLKDQKNKTVEAIKDQKDKITGGLNKQLKKTEKQTDLTVKHQDSIAQNMKDQMDQTAKLAADEKFMKQAEDDPKKGKKGKLASWIKWLGLGALALGLFGKKGIIAVAAGAFFLKLLPMLLKKGLSGAFTLFTTGFKKMGNFAINLVKNPKAALTMLKGVGAKAGSIAMKAGPIAAFVGLTMHDLLKKGGGLEQMKEGKVGKGIATTLFGSDMTKAGAKDVALNIGKQSLKYASLGFAIGGPLGAAVGAGIGGLGAGIKTLWEKGWIQHFGKVIKKNWLGAILGGTLGTFIVPGIGTVIGAIGGAWIQDKIRDPKVREKMKNAFMSVAGKIGGAFKKVGGAIGGFAKKIWTKFTKNIKDNKTGSIIGGILGSVVPGPGTILGIMAGGYIQKKLRDIGIGGKIKEFAGKLIGGIKKLWAGVKTIFSSPQKIPGMLKYLKDKTKEIIFGLASTLFDWAKSLWTKIVDIIGGGASKAKTGLTGQWSQMEALRKEMYEGYEKDKDKTDKEALKIAKENAEANKRTAATIAATLKAHMPWVTWGGDPILGTNPKSQKTNNASKTPKS